MYKHCWAHHRAAPLDCVLRKGDLSLLDVAIVALFGWLLVSCFVLCFIFRVTCWTIEQRGGQVEEGKLSQRRFVK